MPKKWIQKANLKEGTLSKQLGIPIEENIPITLLKLIMRSEIGMFIRNPTKIGKRQYKITRLMKHRASLALTLKKIKRK